MASPHKAAICKVASQAAAEEIQAKIDDGLTTETQNQQIIAAHEQHIHSLVLIASEINDD